MKIPARIMASASGIFDPLAGSGNSNIQFSSVITYKYGVFLTRPDFLKISENTIYFY